MSSQYINRAYKKDDSTRECIDGTWGSGFELKEGRFMLDIRNNFIFSMGLFRYRKKLPREVVDAPLLEMFRVGLGWTLSNMI